MKTEKGMTLVEVIVTFFISTMIMIAGYGIYHWTAVAFASNSTDYQNYSKLQNTTMWVIRDLRKTDAGSVSVGNSGKSLNVGSEVFSFNGNNLVKTAGGYTTIVATNVTGNFSAQSTANGCLSVVINISDGTSPQRYLQSTVTVYPVLLLP